MIKLKIAFTKYFLVLNKIFKKYVKNLKSKLKYYNYLFIK